jgi:superfamily II RNA helicase
MTSTYNTIVLTGECNVDQNEFFMKFPYECDHFQKHAFMCISQNSDVLVTAHTGSGKTTVAEFAILNTIKNGKNAIYTSPIKSLSNEKYNDFKKKYSNDETIKIGLMTGDNKINPNGNCVIMTAEILRNALYKLKDSKDSDDFINNIGCVVMDEVHFINDANRGKVWEETIILLEKTVQLVMLSATIDQPENFASWISKTRKKDVYLIPTNFRAVPLKHMIFTGKEKGKMHTILENDKYCQKNIDNARLCYESSKEPNDKICEIVEYLKINNMLQTIFFSFSKKNCEKYASYIFKRQSLLDQNELKSVINMFDNYMHKYDEQYSGIEQYAIVKKYIEKGIAFHHAGLMPVLKEIIELLFKQKLVKVLFATETFAVGVNMPTKTVVFTELEKHDGISRRNLSPGEYKQMSGRAGRRGIDILGNVVILPLYEFPDNTVLEKMIRGKVQSIKSQLKIDYSFVLKSCLSQVISIDEFVEKSLFSQDVNKIVESLDHDVTILANNCSSFSNKNIDLCEELFKLENNDPLGLGLKVTLTKQQKKRHQELKRIISKKECDEYILYMDNSQKLATKLEDLEYYETYAKSQIKKLCIVLNKFDYMNENMIQKKGIIAAQINECNPLLLTEIISQKLLTGLTANEIVGLLAIFIESDKESEGENEKFDNELANINCLVKKVRNIIDEFGLHDCELDESWNINTDFIKSAYDWANGIFNTDVYIGTFIKSMIKINNIATDMIHLCQLADYIEIIPTLSTIESKILRDFVTVNSLYLL